MAREIVKPIQMCVGETSNSKLDSLESERCDPGIGDEDVVNGWQPDVVNLEALRCDGGAEMGQGDYEVQEGSLVLTPCVEDPATTGTKNSKRSRPASEQQTATSPPPRAARRTPRRKARRPPQARTHLTPPRVTPSAPHRLRGLRFHRSGPGSISKLFNAKIQKSQSSSQVEEASGEDMNEVHVELNESVVANEEFSKEEASGEDMDEAHESEDVDVANDEFREEHNEDNLRDGGVNEEASVSMLDLEKDVDVNYDPGLWGIINDTKRVMLVKKGPIKILKENDEFPKEPNRGRHFSSKLYTSNRPNGEKQERKWLVYSNELDKVFCFCCKLFKHNPMTTGLAEDGINDWHNLPTKLRDHEKNPEHNLNVVKWVDLQMRLKQEATIDKQVEALINKERIRWKLILARIIGVVKTLSRNSLPFRGSNEKIYEKNNGLFCQLIEFLAEFDPIMKDHLRRVGLSPKALSVTRWESHIESVRAIRSQPEELRDALIEISNTSKDDVVMAEAKGLCFNALEDFEFLISLCIWYKILDKG
uniref:TTF-type domain-containing protein n=1 Tax=Fagus sylvatica TaxID=28930 RepID=A0A2N9GKQ8_FAGSY